MPAQVRLSKTSWLSFVVVLVGLSADLHAQTLPDVIDRALRAYPAVQAAAAQTAAARAEVNRARSAHYPQLGMSATASAYASGGLPPGASRTALSPTAKVSLWSGGKIEADVERAQALTVASEFLEASTLDEVALLAAEAYLNWARTADLYSLAVHNFNAHQDTLNDIKQIADADRGRRVDYEQALVRNENALLALQQRKSDFTQAIQRLQRFWPDEMASRPFGLDALVADGGALGNIPTSLAQAVGMVSSNLPTIAQAQAKVHAAQASVRMAKSQHSPVIDLTLSRQQNQFTGKQDAITQIQVNAPLYNGGGTAALVDGALGQLKAAEFALDEANILAKEKVALAWQEWAAAQARSSTGASQSLVGDKLVEAYRQQFRIAKRSLLDLLNIQADAFSYRTASRASFHDERLARVRFLAATGELADRFSSSPGAVMSPLR
jgi:outer membrane protein TolC